MIKNKVSKLSSKERERQHCEQRRGAELLLKVLTLSFPMRLSKNLSPVRLSPGIKTKNKSKTNQRPQENHHAPSDLLSMKGGMGHFKESHYRKLKIHVLGLKLSC